jgi:hypothetical protein
MPFSETSVPQEPDKTPVRQCRLLILLGHCGLSSTLFVIEEGVVDYSETPKKSAIQAKFEAQKIAFAPIVFQASKALCDLGILQKIREVNPSGISSHDLAEELGFSEYGVRVLLEVALSSELVRFEEGRYYLLTTGHFLLEDEMAQVNMNFVNDVCYQGMFSLQDAIKAGAPSGLKVFAKGPTIYDSLATLPEPVQKSWFEFDHFYSDVAFPLLLPLVFEKKPKKVLDVGGNTGKWALQCLQHDSSVEVTIADLPGQLDKAISNIKQAGYSDRFSAHTLNILEDSSTLPTDHDVIWMSQFLDCFSANQITSILLKAKAAMHDNTSLYILETFWDRQKYPAASFCLHNISLYFTCMANGCSKMYHSDEMKQCIQKADLRVVEQTDHIGHGHTLLECRK